ncbi:Transcriptional activator protein acu-15 [Paramyrothecium foliicola]|nr:Transcriptional activator protein acu-15 [Paramyrothecium foliicola]
MNPPDRPLKKRRRPPLACEPCRSRKIRCDRAAPCGPCSKSRLFTCTYAPSHVPKGLANSTISPALDPKPLTPEETDDGVYLRSEFFKSTPFPVGLAASVSSPPSSRAGSASQSQSSTVDALLARVKQLEEKLASTEISHRPTDGRILSHYEESPIPVKGNRGTVSKTRYFGQGHWLSSIDLFPEQIKMFQRAAAEKNELCELLVKCKRIGRRIKENRFKPLSSINIGKQIPQRELADQLVEIYLRTFEGTIRILHVSTFRAEYERYWQNPEAASDAFVIQLQLVMALGCVLFDDTFSLRSLAVTWVHEAQLWLILPPEKARMTMTGIQIRCLLCLARATSSVSHDLIWSFAGSLVRTAMAMGYHRDPKHLTQMTVYRAEMRRRLWATILELNLQSSFDAGGSALLSISDYDTALPADLNDDELTDEPDGQASAKKAREQPTGISVQLELLKSLQLRMNLLKQVNEFRTDSSYNETLRLNSELTKACRALSRNLNMFLQKDIANGSNRVTIFHTSMVEILAYRGFHALHQPVITRSFKDPKFYFSRKMCVESSLKIVDLSNLSRLNQPGAVPGQTDTNRLTVNASGLFRHIRMQAMIAISLELMHQNGEESHSLGYLSATETSDLRASMEAATEWFFARLRSGETNIKGNCFIASCLGHAEALELGLGPEETDDMILQRTTECARVCFQYLKGVAENEGVPFQENGEEIMDFDTGAELPMDWLGSLSWDDVADQGWSGFPQSPFTIPSTVDGIT